MWISNDDCVCCERDSVPSVAHWSDANHILTEFWQKNPVVGKSAGRLGIATSHVATDVCGIPTAVPIFILGVVLSIFVLGAAGVR